MGDIPESWTWEVDFEQPPHPDILEPADGATVDTGKPTISGRAMPGGYVIVVVDGNQNGEPVQVGEDGHWVFQPRALLGSGEHSLSGKTMDVHGRISASASRETVFNVLLPKDPAGDTVARAIGGGVGCSTSGSAGSFVWCLSAWALVSLRRRRGS